MHWNGKTWAEVTTPGLKFGGLGAMSAVSANDVWAVGSVENAEGTDDHILIMHWNGTSWRRDVTAPNVAGELFAVAAVGSEVWAVGRSYLLQQALILHRVSGRWYVVASPVPVHTALFGVTATGAKSAWAAGFSNPLSVVLRWNGEVWRSIASPVSFSEGYLQGITAGPQGTPWVFGTAFATGTTYQMGVSFLWTGKAWQKFSAPGVDGFSDISAIPGGGYWGSGDEEVGNTSASCTIPIVRWNGNSWGPAKETINGTGCPSVSGVAAISASNAWAVGSFDTAKLPLIMHWNGNTWQEII